MSWIGVLTFGWFAARREADAGGRARPSHARDTHPSDPPLAAPADTMVSAHTRRRAATVIDGMSSDVLVAQIRAGNTSVLAAVYGRFYQPLWYLAAALTHADDHAHEVTQDVFLSLWERRETLRIHGDIEAYLYAAVRYRAARVRRHHRVVDRVAERVASQAGDLPETTPGLGQPPAQPDDAMEVRALGRAVTEALDTLPERSRAALLLRWQDGFTFDEIGRILGVSAPAVHKLVARAQAKLLPLLERHRDSAAG